MPDHAVPGIDAGGGDAEKKLQALDLRLKSMCDELWRAVSELREGLRDLRGQVSVGPPAALGDGIQEQLSEHAVWMGRVQQQQNDAHVALKEVQVDLEERLARAVTEMRVELRAREDAGREQHALQAEVASLGERLESEADRAAAMAREQREALDSVEYRVGAESQRRCKEVAATLQAVQAGLEQRLDERDARLAELIKELGQAQQQRKTSDKVIDESQGKLRSFQDNHERLKQQLEELVEGNREVHGDIRRLSASVANAVQQSELFLLREDVGELSRRQRRVEQQAESRTAEEAQSIADLWRLREGLRDLERREADAKAGLRDHLLSVVEARVSTVSAIEARVGSAEQRLADAEGRVAALDKAEKFAAQRLDSVEATERRTAQNMADAETRTAHQMQRLAAEVAERIDQERAANFESCEALQQRFGSAEERLEEVEQLGRVVGQRLQESGEWQEICQRRLLQLEQVTAAQHQCLAAHESRLAGLQQNSARLAEEGRAEEARTAEALNAFQNEVRLWTKMVQHGGQCPPPTWHLAHSGV